MRLKKPGGQLTAGFFSFQLIRHKRCRIKKRTKILRTNFRNPLFNKRLFCYNGSRKFTAGKMPFECSRQEEITNEFTFEPVDWMDFTDFGVCGGQWSGKRCADNYADALGQPDWRLRAVDGAAWVLHGNPAGAAGAAGAGPHGTSCQKKMNFF